MTNSVLKKWGIPAAAAAVAAVSAGGTVYTVQDTLHQIELDVQRIKDKHNHYHAVAEETQSVRKHFAEELNRPLSEREACVTDNFAPRLLAIKGDVDIYQNYGGWALYFADFLRTPGSLPANFQHVANICGFNALESDFRQAGTKLLERNMENFYDQLGDKYYTKMNIDKPTYPQTSYIQGHPFAKVKLE